MVGGPFVGREAARGRRGDGRVPDHLPEPDGHGVHPSPTHRVRPSGAAASPLGLDRRPLHVPPRCSGASGPVSRA